MRERERERERESERKRERTDMRRGKMKGGIREEREGG